MKIEELINSEPYFLESTDDKTFLEWFEKEGYLNITRPERSSAVVKKAEQRMAIENPKLKLGMDLLKGLGVDVGNALQPYKKKK